ncbi:unnamed protein product [Sphagnum balticum]
MDEEVDYNVKTSTPNYGRATKAPRLQDDEAISVTSRKRGRPRKNDSKGMPELVKKIKTSKGEIRKNEPKRKKEEPLSGMKRREGGEKVRELRANFSENGYL